MKATLIESLAEGLPLMPQPYKDMALRTGLNEAAILDAIKELQDKNIIRRFGVVVRHRELGWLSNAMCVWDIPDDKVTTIGQAARNYSFVTLCYSRRRAQPQWPYNFYCMIHGKDRATVNKQRALLATELELDQYPHKILFSTRCFKQRGARHTQQSTPTALTSGEDLDRVLINKLQHGIPVIERPFATLAAELKITEDTIVSRIQALLESGKLSRFGPMFNVEKFGGIFVLAAMKVPQERWTEVNNIVNSYPEVAHNYEREHALNMWFVVATEKLEQNQAVIEDIQRRTGIEVLAFPKEKEFFLELKLET